MSSPAAASDLLTAIRGIVVWALERHQVDAVQARATATEACREICRHWGGDTHWLPTVDRADRNAVILEAARNGASLNSVAQACGVSVRTVARVVKRQGNGLGPDDWVL